MFIKYFPGALALFICLAALPLVKELAHRFHLYDAPGPLKIHRGSIPRLGGIAMFAGFLAGNLIFCVPAWKTTLVPLLVFAGVWAVGLIDDLKGLTSAFRFAVQIAAGAAVWFAGWRLQWFSSPLLDLAATCLFVAFIVNAMNLLDGMDGLAAGTGVIVCIGFLLISAVDGNFLEIALAASLLGACAGVLAVNAPPAKMFMGDSGSTLIGIVLAFLSLNWVRDQSGPRGILVPLIFLSVPIADGILAILRRVRAHQKLFTGDRRHFYDILLQRGWTVEGVLRLAMGVTATLVFAGWLCSRGIAGDWIISVVVVCGLAAAAILLGSLQPDLTSVPANQPETPIGPAIE
jgi:UDP-GlcNAc:undecaprenyl-phosphate/decaprenyl-phosphate GlcNAc-1-phosphate transferase